MDYFEAFLPCHDRVKLLGTYQNRGRCSISFLWRGCENAAGWSKKWTWEIRLLSGCSLSESPRLRWSVAKVSYCSAVIDDWLAPILIVNESVEALHPFIKCPCPSRMFAMFHSQSYRGCRQCPPMFAKRPRRSMQQLFWRLCLHGGWEPANIIATRISWIGVVLKSDGHRQSHFLRFLSTWQQAATTCTGRRPFPGAPTGRGVALELAGKITRSFTCSQLVSKCTKNALLQKLFLRLRCNDRVNTAVFMIWRPRQIQMLSYKHIYI